jgi:hypothetical protein
MVFGWWTPVPDSADVLGRKIISLMELSSILKDYYDIYFISNTFTFDARKLQEAISGTIEKGPRCLTPTYEYSGEHQRDPFRILFYIGVSSGELILLTNDQTRK